MRGKKASTPIAITILVIATLVLTIFSLFYFSIREKGLEKKLYTSAVLEEIYSKETLINYYIQTAVDEAASDSNSKEGFLSSLEKTLAEYKDVDNNYPIEELSQIQPQLILSKITINEKTAQDTGKKETSFVISLSFEIKDEKYFPITYRYLKNFSNSK